LISENCSVFCDGSNLVEETARLRKEARRSISRQRDRVDTGF
jgi:hypothetical protein